MSSVTLERSLTLSIPKGRRLAGAVASPDGARLFGATASVWVEGAHPSIASWDTATGQMISAVQPPPFQVEKQAPRYRTPVAVALSRDGRLLAVSLSTNGLGVWDTRNMESVRFYGRASRLKEIAFSPSSHWLAGVYATDVKSALQYCLY